MVPALENRNRGTTVKAEDATSLIEDLNRKIAIESGLLAAAAENVQNLQGHEDEPLRWFADTKFLILQFDFDLMVAIRAMLVDDSTRLTMEKTVALTLAEVEPAIGAALQGLGRSVRAPTAQTADQFDIALLDAASVRFKQALRPMRDDKEFMSTLLLVRNTVAAHLWGKKNARVNGSAQWVLSRRGAPTGLEGVLRSQFVAHAIRALSALHVLADDLASAWAPERAASPQR